MQFAILLLGALVFVFYQFYPAPIFFNKVQTDRVEASVYRQDGQRLTAQYDSLSAVRQKVVSAYSQAVTHGDTLEESQTGKRLQTLLTQSTQVRTSYQNLLHKPGLTGGDNNDTNYIFLRWVIDHMPIGLVGLLIAIIFLAAWGSIAAALNALASCSVVDIHKKFIQKNCTHLEDYRLAKWYTLGWGLFCIGTAMFASHLGSLIEAVNVLGSLFYGTMLGIFLVAFYVKSAGGKIVFWSAIIVELCIIALFRWSSIGFLWLNAIGALGVLLISWVWAMVAPAASVKNEP
jgi:SSS family solute:Na+ symporter